MTKAEELKILEQVRKLIEPTWYVKTAFEGVLDYAERNIADDAAYNPVEELGKAYKDGLRKDAEMGQKILRLEHERDAMAETLKAKDSEIEKLGHIADSWEKNAHDAGELYCELEKECAEMRRDMEGSISAMKEKDAEIIRLKAELYDYMRKERD